MDQPAARFAEFVHYVHTHLSGDEKGEAHLFCDRLFQAFGHKGLKEVGGTLEYRIHKGSTTKFADLLWRPRLLLEMKKRGEKLVKHQQQAFDYWWNLVPNRPQYVILCNFDEFWIYDLNVQLDEPMDRVTLDELPKRYTALNFLFPDERKPLFQNDRVGVTRKAADKVAQVFNLLVERQNNPVPRERAQRFILQCVIALFSEDIGLLPRGLFTELLQECKGRASSYDLIGGLFRQMANRNPADAGRFKEVDYFNGGIFEVIEPVELRGMEIELLAESADFDWSRVNPAIFGTLFEGSMGKKERHAFGAHFTSETDILKVVRPTIVQPWRQRIAAAKKNELLDLRKELLAYHVLDPACGSGNFLYVAYRELKRLELELLDKIADNVGKIAREAAGTTPLVSASQFYGIDIKPFAVELAKVTLMLAKKLALDETQALLATGEQHLPFDETEKPLPLDNLNANIRCDDALFCAWPEAAAIIGNPPYLDARKTTIIHGIEYSKKIREKYPEVPGRSDFCVHWFRRAHDELKPGGRAGLVGTNSIRQNYSREGGLDYIVNNGGTITEAVSTQPWSGEAAVHVSIVNWIKGEHKGPKKLFSQLGEKNTNPWVVEELERIPSALSARVDVTSAVHIQRNKNPKVCLEGQQPGHKGFCINEAKFREFSKADKNCAHIVHPILNGDDLISSTYRHAPSWVIDFGDCDIFEAKKHDAIFRHLQAAVLPLWSTNALDEKKKTGKDTGEHQNRLQYWWLLKRRRGELIEGINKLSRYVVCSAVTKRPIFEFVSKLVRPSNALKAFLFEDDYSFGILQSGIHWSWFTAKCSTLTERFRYTPDTVFDTFPWPQSPTLKQVQAVAKAAVALRELRRKTMAVNAWSLRDLYRTLELPGANPLRDAHVALDAAVRAAYGMKPKEDPLAFLLALNHAVAAREKKNEPVVAPGLPPCVTDPAELVTEDCVAPPKLT